MRSLHRGTDSRIVARAIVLVRPAAAKFEICGIQLLPVGYGTLVRPSTRAYNALQCLFRLVVLRGLRCCAGCCSHAGISDSFLPVVTAYD